MKILFNLQKFDDVVKNDGSGGCIRIVRGNLAMRIDYTYNKLIECTLFLLDIDYNIGLVYI